MHQLTIEGEWRETKNNYFFRSLTPITAQELAHSQQEWSEEHNIFLLLLTKLTAHSVRT